ncbi:hypothetical protein LguiB_006200 [Lonicera macranthoides]
MAHVYGYSPWALKRDGMGLTLGGGEIIAKRSHRSLSRSPSRSVSLRARSESYPSCSVSRFDQDPGLHWRLLLAASGRLEAQCTVAAGAEAGVFLAKFNEHKLDD